MTNYRIGPVLLTAAAMAASATLAIAAESATKTAPAEAGSDLTEVTVTARRRDEKIVDVPLAISVVSERDIAKLGITSTNELAKYVPGLEFSDFTPGYSRNDRGGNRPLIFRGLPLGVGASGGAVVAPGGLFLDGAAVVGNEVPAGADIGAVEVLRGPQSVYFGRATMTGAVSYRTKAIPKEWQFAGEAGYAQRSDQRLGLSVAGPLIDGVLGMRLSGLSEKTGGYVSNDYNGSDLGDRTRESYSITLNFTPLDALEIKAYANKFNDDDGASATTFISPTFSIAAGCKRPGATRFTFCGEIPSPGNSINYINTDIPLASKNVIFDGPLINGTGFDRKVGLQREVLNSHLVANLKLGDYLTLQSITGYHTNVTMQVADGIGEKPTVFFANATYWYTITNRAKDFSQELRLSSDSNRKFSWTVGANYIDAWGKTHAINAFQQQAFGTGVLAPSLFTPAQNVNAQGAKTTGFFGGAYLKLLDDRLTLSAEARYQTDKRRDWAVTGAGVPVNDLHQDFKSTNPRLSVDYDVGGGRKVYASYASGTRPGGFNVALKGFLDRNDPVLTGQIQTALGLTTFTYDEEKLKVAELGFKGNFADGKGYFDINAYTGKLTNQQISYGALIPVLGFTVTATANIGETRIHGVEWQGNFNFTRSVSLATTFSFNATDRNKFTNTAGIAQFGTTNFDGTEMPNAPKISGSAVLSYTTGLSNNWEFFSNTALVYRGKQFMDIANLSYIPGRYQADLRFGVSRNQYRFEGYVLNVFDDRKYTGGNVATDFGGPGDAAGAYSSRAYAFYGGAAPPRQVGVRLNVNF